MFVRVDGTSKSSPVAHPRTLLRHPGSLGPTLRRPWALLPQSRVGGESRQVEGVGGRNLRLIGLWRSCRDPKGRLELGPNRGRDRVFKTRSVGVPNRGGYGGVGGRR